MAHSSSGVMKVRGSGARQRKMRTQKFKRDVRGHRMLSENQKKMGDHSVTILPKRPFVKKSKKFPFLTHQCLICCLIKKQFNDENLTLLKNNLSKKLLNLRNHSLSNRLIWNVFQSASSIK